MIAAFATLLFMVGAACGWGGLILRATRMDLPAREQWPWAFALGMGVLGWLAFFAALAGVVSPIALALVCAPGLVGVRWLSLPVPAAEPPTPWTWLLAAALVAVALGDLAEGLTPPTDADSLAYHFAIPRQMLLTGGLVFVERAADGAVPLLQQASSMIALALGGETAMTLWAGATGWAAGWLTYAVGRRWLGRDWALAAALVVLTVPGHVYGSGTGQVEARLEAFVLVSVMALAASRQTSGLCPAILAGVAVGFAVASKYPALLVAFLAGLALLVQNRGMLKAAAFSTAVLAFGGQWYGWNWWNTGDPFFPMLFGLVPYRDGVAWDAAANAAFKIWSSTIESPLPRSPVDILLYPLTVTLDPHPGVEAGRTGLGPLPWLLLPFAMAGAWMGRRRLWASPLGLGLGLTLGFYVLWSLFGASQRVRHYVPFVPLIVLAMTVAVRRVDWPGIRRAAAAAVAISIAIQLAGFGVFSLVFVKHLASGESRWDYLERTVGHSFAVRWANGNLRPDDKVLTTIRQWLYLLDVPYQYVTPNQQAIVNVRPEDAAVEGYWRQIRAIGVTHILLPVMGGQDVASSDMRNANGLTAALIANGCAQSPTILEGPAPVQSRTLGTQGAARGLVAVTALTPETCPIR